MDFNVYKNDLVTRFPQYVISDSVDGGGFRASSNIVSTMIDSVGNNGGVAVFTHTGEPPPVGSTVTITGYITNTAYNGVQPVTVSGATTFETGVSFGSDEATGDYTAVVNISDFKLSLLDAYRSLRGKMLDGENPLPLSTLVERDALVNIDDGFNILNTTNNQVQTRLSPGWVSSDNQLKAVFNAPFAYFSSNIVTVPSGSWRDDTDIFTINFSSSSFLNIGTSGAGGLQTGSTQAANTWYGAYVIADTTGVNANNVLLIPDGVAFNQSGYDVIRNIGWVRNNAGSDFFRFNAAGAGRAQVYLFDIDSQSEILAAGGATTFTDIDCSEFMPSVSTAGLFQMGVTCSTPFAGMTIRPNGAGGTYNAFIIRPGVTTTITNRSFAIMFTDSSQLIEYRVLNGADDAYLSVQGFEVNI